MDREVIMNNYDNFFLPVDNMTAAANYYRDVLGMKIKFDFSPLGMVAFNVGEQEPAIILKDTAKFPDAKPAIWFVVDDVASEYKKLSGMGVKFISEPFPIKTGLAAEFDDPFGNRLGITDYTLIK
jgi:predicted enzyme related to lactoylglutathione lyase